MKLCNKPIRLDKIAGKSIFLSSVTDCYNHFEHTYKITRAILQQLKNCDAQVTISTKSSLILRDLNLLTQFKHLKVAVSINTMDENFRNDMDQADTIKKRLSTLKALHQQHIHTVLFLSPIFPYITDCKEIICRTRKDVDEYWFENLNLRGQYKTDILSYIETHYPEYLKEYHNIYLKHDNTYWKQLSMQLDDYCSQQDITFTNYFYHTTCSGKEESSNLLVHC